MSKPPAHLSVLCALALFAMTAHAQEVLHVAPSDRQGHVSEAESSRKALCGKSRKKKKRQADASVTAVGGRSGSGSSSGSGSGSGKRGKRGRKSKEAPPPPPPPPPPKPEPPIEDLEPEPQPIAEEPTPEPEPEPVSDCSFFGTAPCAPQRGFAARLTAGAGVTMRNITITAASGPAPLRTGLVPAVGLQLGMRWIGEDSSVDLTVAYQSSINAHADQTASDPAQPPVSTTIQSHHLDVGVTPRLHFSDRPDSTTLGIFVGYGVRALGSVVELRVPRFSLHGPVGRVELIVPLGSPRIMLRIAPEAQLIVSVSQDLVEMSSVNLGRLLWAFGGEAAIDLQLGARFGVQLAYRESHAFASDANKGSFEDVERFVLLGFAVSYF